MADRKGFTKYNIQYGLILRSPIGHSKLLGFNLPNLDKSFFILKGEDLEGNNSISFIDGDIPIFASGEIAYKGQPLLALFGPDFESVEIALSKITPITEPIDEESGPTEFIEPYEYSFGKEQIPSDEELSKMRKTESEFTFNATLFSNPYRYATYAWLDGKGITIESPSQWEEPIRKNVSYHTGISENLIEIINQKHFSKRDEYLITPVIFSVIAAIAAKKTGLPTRMRSVARAARPQFKIKKTTYFDEEGNMAFEDADMSVDQGAYPIAPHELQRQAMAGLLPLYRVGRFRGRVSILKSFNAPASFSGGLGYPEASAASSVHISKLPMKNTLTPIQYFDSFDSGSTKFNDILPSIDISEYQDSIEKISELSSYNRKWMTNSLMKSEFGLMGNIRGIGFAMAVGIAGFSTTFAKHSPFEAQITYTQKHNISLNTSGSSSRDIEYWKSIIENEIVEKKGSEGALIFIERSSDTIDSGPDTLNRFTSCLTPQLKEAAMKIDSIKDKEKPPISIRFKVENPNSPCEFEPSGFGAEIIELSISEYSYKPVVRNIWATLNLDNVINTKDVKERIKRHILLTLEECGAVLSNTCKINLSIVDHNKNDGILSSIVAIAKSMTMGAFLNALKQATGKESPELPTGAVNIESLLSGRSNEN